MSIFYFKERTGNDSLRLGLCIVYRADFPSIFADLISGMIQEAAVNLSYGNHIYGDTVIVVSCLGTKLLNYGLGIILENGSKLM